MGPKTLPCTANGRSPQKFSHNQETWRLHPARGSQNCHLPQTCLCSASDLCPLSTYLTSQPRAFTRDAQRIHKPRQNGERRGKAERTATLNMAWDSRLTSLSLHQFLKSRALQFFLALKETQFQNHDGFLSNACCHLLSLSSGVRVTR